MNKYNQMNQPGRDAAGRKAATEQSQFEAMHNSNNAFVKSQEAKLKALGGKAPSLSEEATHMNAYMCNNGMHAQELASKLTAGFDHAAFPVKGAK